MEGSPSVLMYHCFDEQGWKFGVNPDDLRKQIDYLLKTKTIVSIADIVSYVNGEKEIPKNSVAITIDDGYEDTYLVFFKIAKECNIPFTLFLTTDLSQKPQLGNLRRPNKNQLIEMRDSGLVIFGLHGHTHKHFTEVFAENSIESEIEQSELFLKKEIGISPEYVAYPSGKFDEQVISYFSNNNEYKGGFTIKSGFIKKRADRLRLPRIEVSRNTQTMLLFKLRLTPALVVYNKILLFFR